MAIFSGSLQRLQSLHDLAIVLFDSSFRIAFSSVTGLVVGNLATIVSTALELISRLVTSGFGFAEGDAGGSGQFTV